MRIVGGNFKGKSFKYKIPRNIRPTSDFIREAIFDVLQNYIDLEGKNVLDLFAGTGIFGIEALSRGAKFCHFVDNNRKSLELITLNLKSLNIEKEKYKITLADALHFVKTYKNQLKFDLIFSDPPYNFGFNEKLISSESVDNISQNGTIFVLEVSRKEAIELSNKFILFNKKEYGDTIVYFLKYMFDFKE